MWDVCFGVIEPTDPIQICMKLLNDMHVDDFFEVDFERL